MSRSILTTFFVVVLVAMNTNQAFGLMGVFNRVRNNGVWGKRVKTTGSRHVNSVLPVQGVAIKEASGDQPSSPISPQTESFFDEDTYRQQMINLVYERNVQRTFDN